MPRISQSPQVPGFLAAVLYLGICSGCCCGQGWVVPPESSEFDDPGTVAVEHCGRRFDQGCRHHRPWLHHRPLLHQGAGLFAGKEEAEPFPYPKFHPVPARPVFGTTSVVAWPAPAEPPLPHSPPPASDQEITPRPSRTPAPSPSQDSGAPSTDNHSHPPQLLGTAGPRASWVFPPRAVKPLTASAATRRLAIPEPETRQALQERTQPIRR